MGTRQERGDCVKGSLGGRCPATRVAVQDTVRLASFHITVMPADSHVCASARRWCTHWTTVAESCYIYVLWVLCCIMWREIYIIEDLPVV